MMAKEMKEKDIPIPIRRKSIAKKMLMERSLQKVRKTGFVSESNFISAPSHKAYHSIENLSGWPDHGEISSNKETLRLGKTTMKFS
jgi:hypothetical protein